MSAPPERGGRTLETPHGPGRMVTADAHGSGEPMVRLLVSHGAGAGIGTPDLLGLAELLPRRGVGVVLLEQPWVVAGRRLATAPATLDDALLLAAAALPDDGVPLVLGGRSAGARSAARCAVAAGAVGCLALSFPLHPPRRPERTRLPELLGAGVPTLVVQGERDALGTPAEFPDDLAAHGARLEMVPRADHSLRAPRRTGPDEAEVVALLDEVVGRWLEQFVAEPT